MITKIFHPNITKNGIVDLNILRGDWSPILNLNAVFLSLLFLLIEPDPDGKKFV
jgi:ubiquitin-conjugating enzyme E2 M